MRKATIGLLLAVAAPALAAPAPRTPGAQAKAFLDGLYRPWIRQLHNPYGRYQTPADDLVYIPEIAALMKKDMAIAERTGDVGVIDWVVLCGCQDEGGLEAKVTVPTATATTATAKVALSFAGGYAKTLTIRLVKLKQGGRIADVADPPDMPSLLALLRSKLRGKS